MCLTHMQKKKKNRGAQETLGSVGYVYYLDCGDDMRGVYIHPIHQIMNFKYVQFFIYQLYLNESV
jgi:hypothetical protein